MRGLPGMPRFATMGCSSACRWVRARSLDGRPRASITRAGPPARYPPVGRTGLSDRAPGVRRTMKGSVAVLTAILVCPASTLGDDRTLDWIRVTDRAGWQPRDSAGEVVFQDRLWILGGWFDSFSAPPRDVWSSPDGR